MTERGIQRRTFLRGLGGTLALPMLEGLAWGKDPAAAAPPRRLLFVYVPNGKHMADWTPKKTGASFQLPHLLEPLAKHKQDLLLLTGLTLDGARSHGDGPGDHARSLASFLTCVHPRKTAGADIRCGVSVDQVAARKLGRTTRFSSLELGCERSRQSGSCDSGYSCAYSSNLSWRSSTTPAGKEIDPQLVFDRLFGRPLTPKQRARRNRRRKSVLDVVREDARALRARLGRSDRAKLDEYLTGVRELERRITHSATGGPGAPKIELARPGGIPRHPRDHIRRMADLIALAFQTDATRVCTFLIGNAGSNRSYRFLGVPEGHHYLSHHGRKKAKQEKIRKINRFHTEQLAYLLDRLKAVKVGQGTLLDHTTVVYGSGLSDGNRHNHDDLPVLVAGRGGGVVTPGRHLRFERGTPLANLYLSLLRGHGVHAQRFGDSSGPLPGLRV